MARADSGLPEQIADKIIQLILDEHLEQGDRLPKEAVLVERLGAGRSTVREAMKLLQSRNIVRIKQGSGTYVASNPGVADDPLGFTFIDDKQRLARDLLEVRFMIEPQIARMAAEHATNDQVVCIKELCDESERLAEAGEDYSTADTAFHNAIAESSGNLVVPRLMGVFKASVPLFIDVTGKNARRGNYPHAPRCGRRHRLTQSHRSARCDVFASGVQPQHDRRGHAGTERINVRAARARSPFTF